jgi:hypothetical protein
VTVPLVGLSPPDQLACTGVSVYTQLPLGTDCSTQEVVVIVPLHPAPTVAGEPLAAL